MQYRTLGRSGCAVSALALGTMTFGREADEASSRAQLDRFAAAGGTLIDTADVYADTASESIVGRWLAAQDAPVRERMVIASKGRFPTGPGPNDLGLSRRHLQTALDASLRRLGVDTIDLYQVHAWDPLTPIEETIRFFDDAVTAGKIRYFGLSNFTAWQLQKTMDLASFHGRVAPVTLQPQYNLLARDIEWEIVPACLENGLGLLPWSPLGGGWLTGKYSPEQRPSGQTRLGENPDRGVEAYDRRNTERVWNVVAVVHAVAEETGASMAQVALAWLLQRPAVTAVILGARTPAQLDDNLGAVDVELSEEQVRRLDEVSAPVSNDYPYGANGAEQRSRNIAGGR